MLSVILPVYQVERYLEQAVNCLLSQDIDNIEIILVDDGSTDSSPQLCDALAQRYECVTAIHQENTGVSSARNNGLSAAKGKYIAFLDPDDFIDGGYYKAMLDKLTSTQSDIVFSKYKKLFESDGSTEKHYEKGFDRLEENPLDVSIFFEAYIANADASHVLMGYVWRSIFKKEIIDEYSLRFNEDIDYSEDLLFLLEYLSHCGKCCTVDCCGYNYRVRSNSATAVSYKQNLYKTRKSCLSGFNRVINGCDAMDSEQKSALINRIKYMTAKEIIYNEMRFNKNAVNALLDCFDDGFGELFLDDEALAQAKHDSLDKVNTLILTLARHKLLAPIKLLYSLKYKNEQR